MENRRDILKLAGLSASIGVPLSGAGEKHLPDEVIDTSRAALTRASFGDTRIYFQGPTAQMKSLTAGSLLLKPGQEPHPPHQHPEEEIMVITSGTGEILVGGKNVKVGPGSMMYCEGDKLHGVKNTGSEPMMFYFYKWLA
jgi:mannose-6-phosphate isomerase-like protein (cupin superfamily)